MTNEQIIAAARAAHEANRSWCQLHGDHSQKPWNEATAEIRESAQMGVLGVINGCTPEQSHQSWLDFKKAAGWRYGPVKDEVLKEHPCFVPYGELPPIHKAKDQIYVTAVRAFVDAIASLESSGS
jgi:hypothetical protein